MIYMKINDPSIVMEPIELPQRSSDINGFAIYNFSSQYFYVIDGFEKEGNPCYIVFNRPKI